MSLAHKPVTFANDLNTVEVGGFKFTAVDSEPGRCTANPRCSFAVGFGCDLWRGPTDNPHCRPIHRIDGRSIVWIPATRKGA